MCSTRGLSCVRVSDLRTHTHVMHHTCTHACALARPCSAAPHPSNCPRCNYNPPSDCRRTCLTLDSVRFLLLFLMLYVFGVVGLELIATNSDFKNDPEEPWIKHGCGLCCSASELGKYRVCSSPLPLHCLCFGHCSRAIGRTEANFVIQTHFSSLGMSMITVSQFITMDNISQIYAPLIAIQPLVFIYFGALIAVISISVMNLVTASLVEASLEHAKTLRKEDEMLRHRCLSIGA